MDGVGVMVIPIHGVVVDMVITVVGVEATDIIVFLVVAIVTPIMEAVGVAILVNTLRQMLMLNLTTKYNVLLKFCYF